jgi:hypothetical protein
MARSPGDSDVGSIDSSSGTAFVERQPRPRIFQSAQTVRALRASSPLRTCSGRTGRRVASSVGQQDLELDLLGARGRAARGRASASPEGPPAA